MGGTASAPDPEKVNFVESEIKSSCVVIFSKTSCPYCRMAKQIFENIGQPFHVIELNKRSDTAQIQDILEAMTGERTVPRVFVNGQCIGGGTETKSLHAKGQLLPMIQNCRI